MNLGPAKWPTRTASHWPSHQEVLAPPPAGRGRTWHWRPTGFRRARTRSRASAISCSGWDASIADNSSVRAMTTKSGLPSSSATARIIRSLPFWAFSTAFRKSSRGLNASPRANDGCASQWSVRKLLGTLPGLRQRHPAKSGPESTPLGRVPSPHPAQPALLRGWRCTTTGRDPPRHSATRRAPR